MRNSKLANQAANFRCFWRENEKVHSVLKNMEQHATILKVAMECKSKKGRKILKKNCKIYFKSLLFIALSDIEVDWAILTIPGKSFYTCLMMSTIRSNKCIIYTCCTLLCKIGIVKCFWVVKHYGMWFLWEWIVQEGTVCDWYNQFLNIWVTCKSLTGMFFLGRLCTVRSTRSWRN